MNELGFNLPVYCWTCSSEYSSARWDTSRYCWRSLALHGLSVLGSGSERKRGSWLCVRSRALFLWVRRPFCVFNSRLCSRDLSVCVACVERWSSAAARVLDFNAAFFVCFLVSKLGVGVRSLVRWEISVICPKQLKTVCHFFVLDIFVWLRKALWPNKLAFFGHWKESVSDGKVTEKNLRMVFWWNPVNKWTKQR